MLRNVNTRRRITLFLLLIFFQQIGAGLFVHNLLHDKNETTKTSAKKNENNKEISFTCSCVDDFLMPFTEADEPSVVPRLIVDTEYFTTYTEQKYFTSLIFFSLRGPPALIG